MQTNEGAGIFTHHRSDVERDVEQIRGATLGLLAKFCSYGVMRSSRDVRVGDISHGVPS
jgi:hypothetical protein